MLAFSVPPGSRRIRRPAAELDAIQGVIDRILEEDNGHPIPMYSLNRSTGAARRAHHSIELCAQPLDHLEARALARFDRERTFELFDRPQYHPLGGV
jgi:hypothetical protein